MEIWNKSIAVEEDLIKANEDLAKKNKEFFEKQNITTFEILGNIGSGKTSLIEVLVSELKDKYKILVINGDLATSIDADRIMKYGVEAIQINTGKECHLDALTIKPALEKIKEKIDLLLIEQVGNMICPADFPLGAKKRIVVFEVTNGPYIVQKHPVIFTMTDIVVINKMDIAEYVGMDKKALEKLETDAKKINHKLKVVFTSAKTKQGISALINALEL
ncbi:MAG: hydrogenase nickel incorporation protein HypB [Candidatus Helarchaeota archaeon]